MIAQIAWTFDPPKKQSSTALETQMNTMPNPDDFSAEDKKAHHLADLIDYGVRRFSDKQCFSCVLPSGHTAHLKFSELGAHSDAIAAYLRQELQLKPGDVVAIQGLNTLAYPVLICAIAKAGLIITNLNPLYTPSESNHQLRDSGARVLFCIDLFGDRLEASIAESQVEVIVKLSLTDLFPRAKQLQLNFALQYIKRLIPKASAAYDASFKDALHIGKRHLQKGADIRSYIRGADRRDVLLYQYTGGTTGRAKGAKLSHENITTNIRQILDRNEAAFKGQSQTQLVALPLYHVYALAVGGLSSLVNGAHSVLVPVPRPVSNLKPAFEQFDFTLMPGVNTLYLALLQEEWFQKNPPRTLKYCFAGAALLNSQTAEDWHAQTGAYLYEGYGLTEATCVVTTMPLDKTPKPGSCGKPVAETQMRVVDDAGADLPIGASGELWIRGPQVMQGYLNAPEATAETLTPDGWLKTGDIAEIDEEGYLYIVDRKKDMVIVSGFNVYPTDVEDVLTRHSSVREAAVVGIPCEKTGEKLVAFIVPATNAIDREALTAHCRTHLTNYKVPKIFVERRELPKTPIGKVLRKDLRAQAQDM